MNRSLPRDELFAAAEERVSQLRRTDLVLSWQVCYPAESIISNALRAADHLEVALRLAREEKAAKSAMMAQFGKEISDADGDGDQAGDGLKLRHSATLTDVPGS